MADAIAMEAGSQRQILQGGFGYAECLPAPCRAHDGIAGEDDSASGGGPAIFPGS
jgi:hypothetical protein